MTVLKPTRTTENEGTARKSARPLRFIVLDSEDHWLKEFGRSETAVCDSQTAVRKALERTTSDSLWISSRSEMVEELAKTLIDSISHKVQPRGRFGHLLMLEPAKTRMLPVLEQLFGKVIGAVKGFKRLPLDELIEVLAASPEDRRDVFIGGVMCAEIGSLVLVRGNLEQRIVPLSIFRPSGRATPNFDNFELEDYGHTLRFGEYEATADVVLWEMDQDYRKRMRGRERAHARGFGPSLRRLRKQRGLSQSDFPNVARKTIFRIENGEVEKPHGTTLNRIAKALGVAPEQIETY